jgi:hypothetical protein
MMNKIKNLDINFNIEDIKTILDKLDIKINKKDMKKIYNNVCLFELSKNCVNFYMKHELYTFDGLSYLLKNKEKINDINNYEICLLFTIKDNLKVIIERNKINKNLKTKITIKKSRI